MQLLRGLGRTSLLQGRKSGDGQRNESRHRAVRPGDEERADCVPPSTEAKPPHRCGKPWPFQVSGWPSIVKVETSIADRIAGGTLNESAVVTRRPHQHARSRQAAESEAVQRCFGRWLIPPRSGVVAGEKESRWSRIPDKTTARRPV